MLANDNYHDLVSRYQIERDPHLSCLSVKLDESLIVIDKKIRSPKATEYMETKRRFLDRSSMKENSTRDMVNLSKSVRLAKGSSH